MRMRISREISWILPLLGDRQAGSRWDPEWSVKATEQFIDLVRPACLNVELRHMWAKIPGSRSRETAVFLLPIAFANAISLTRDMSVRSLSMISNSRFYEPTPGRNYMVGVNATYTF
jgi:hypothetical protein